MQHEVYDGIPVPELPIHEVDVPEPLHLRRSLRYPGALDIEPEAAIEAAMDPRALIAKDPKSRTGEAVRVVGYSATVNKLLVVVMLPDEHPPDGLWHVATAWPAERRLRDAYWAEDREEESR
ncbi:MAG: hypothetical protein GEV00_17895 [Actinophytocola sp.]|nr:hypothetical protein [Actinophytocola sp.]